MSRPAPSTCIGQKSRAERLGVAAARFEQNDIGDADGRGDLACQLQRRRDIIRRAACEPREHALSEHQPAGEGGIDAAGNEQHRLAVRHDRSLRFRPASARCRETQLCRRAPMRSPPRPFGPAPVPPIDITASASLSSLTRAPPFAQSLTQSSAPPHSMIGVAPASGLNDTDARHANAHVRNTCNAKQRNVGRAELLPDAEKRLIGRSVAACRQECLRPARRRQALRRDRP